MIHIKTFIGVLLRALVYVLAPLFFYFLINFLLKNLFNLNLSDQLQGFLTDFLIIATTILFFSLYKKEKIKLLCKEKLSFWKMLKLIPISLFARLPILVVIILALIVFGDRINDLTQAGVDYQWSVYDGAEGIDRFFVFISFVFLGPIHEELFFRGVILEFIRKRYTFWASIIISSIYFSLFHLHPGLFISTFILGSLLGYIYLKWKNIWYVIILHMLINSQPFIMDYLEKLVK